MPKPYRPEYVPPIALNTVTPAEVRLMCGNWDATTWLEPRGVETFRYQCPGGMVLGYPRNAVVTGYDQVAMQRIATYILQIINEVGAHTIVCTHRDESECDRCGQVFCYACGYGHRTWCSPEGRTP
jgi:hypothetical protein